jgi:flagellar motor switch protein FliN/FliY
MSNESTPTPPEDQQPDFDAVAREAAEVDDAAGDAASDQVEGAEPIAEMPDPAEQHSADDAAAMAEALLAQVHEAVSDANNANSGARGGASRASAAAPPRPAGSVPMNLPSFDQAVVRAMPAELDLLADVNLDVKIELGRTRLLVDDVLKLTEGAVVELDKLAGDPVDIYVNDRHIARGEVLVLNDNFCVRINEIVEPDSRAAG